MTAEQRYSWRIALELKLRKCSGDSFQDFFSDVMGKVHGTDFVRLRPFGRLGDKGCDGYLQSSGQVYQCYGALNGSFGRVNYLIDKMEEDFTWLSSNWLNNTGASKADPGRLCRNPLPGASPH